VVEAHRAWVEGTPAGEAGELTLDRLSSLLFHTQGITGRMERRSLVFELRAAPSAGALYPTNVYVLVRKVPGLAPGLYLYHPERAALLEVSSDSMLPDHLALATGGSKLVGEAPATVLFSVTFGRTAFKYRERAYRYVGMDTGHAAYNLGVAAAAAGMWAPMLARFDDGAVNAALALDPRMEAVFLIMPLVPRGTAKAAALVGPRFERERASAGGAAFVELVHGGTSLRRSGEGVEVRRHPSRLAAAEGDLALPAPAEGRPLLPSIHYRRSSRDYRRRRSASRSSPRCA
jgi:SagB-type dehydrogenase family enzyme